MTSQLGKNRPLYTERQLSETLRILEKEGYALVLQLDGVLTYANPDTSETVIVMSYSPSAREPTNGVLMFLQSEETVSMRDFVAKKNIEATRPGLPRLLKRITEAAHKL